MTRVYYFGFVTIVSAGTGRVVDAEREAELWAQVRALFDKKYAWSDGLIVELSRAQGPG
jgi:hypothetical protein